MDNTANWVTQTSNSSHGFNWTVYASTLITLDPMPKWNPKPKQIYVTGKPIEITPYENFSVSVNTPSHFTLVTPPADDFYVELNGIRQKPDQEITVQSHDTVAWVLPKKCICDTATLWASGCKCGGC